MRIPNPRRAIVEPSKLLDYLLSEQHEHGRANARFLGRLGYDTSNWQVLRDDLLGQHLLENVARHSESHHGRS